jgi:hypothetical protein
MLHDEEHKVNNIPESGVKQPKLCNLLTIIYKTILNK